MAVVMARRWVCAGAKRVGEALRRKHAWPRAVGLTAHQTLVAAQRRSPPITACVAHVNAKRRRCCPAGGAMPADEVSRCGKCPKFQKISKGQGLCPRTPGSTPCSCCAAPRWRARKKRTSSGGDMESACYAGALRAKREKFFGAFFGGDPASFEPGPCIIAGGAHACP